MSLLFMKIFLFATAFFAGCSSSLFAQSIFPAAPELVSVKKIWHSDKHSAFTDLIHFGGKWLCVFRESAGHVGGNGVIRVLLSGDAENWEPVASLSEEGIDLRDPKLSVTPDNRLMMVLGGSVYEGTKFIERQSRVAFSADGKTWTAPQRILEKGDWLWRVTWHEGVAYGVTYAAAKPGAGQTNRPAGMTVKLVASDDGVAFRPVTQLEVPDSPNETTLRFLKNGDCVALVRREAGDKAAWIGRSSPPFKDWKWHGAGMQIGGPNFIVLDDGRMIASGRQYRNATWSESKTFVGRMDLQSVRAELILPSGGDCSYAGMVWRDGFLWLSYYSSHEGGSDIYFAKVRLPGTDRKE